MKKNYLRLLMLGLLFSIISSGIYAQLYSGGSGTFADPYQIANKADLKYLSEHSADWNKHFIQTDNIIFDNSDFALGGDFYNDGKGFIPIGNNFSFFQGSYDGNYNVITNLIIDRQDELHIGMFGMILYGRVENLSLNNSDIQGYVNTGGIAGYVLAGDIISCKFEGSVTGASYVGGVAGRCETYGEINNCEVDAIVAGIGDVGGILGNFYSENHTQNFKILNCKTTGEISAVDSDAGGLVGRLEVNCTIEKCQSSCTVMGNANVGGFVGSLEENITITDCYALGFVARNGGSNVSLGGFVGTMNQSTITNCYSTGSVSGPGWTPTDRGFIGEYVSGTLTNNYWDTQSSGQATSPGQNNGQLEGKTTAEMQQQATFENWNFTTIWGINAGYNSGYPYLQWLCRASNPNPGHGTKEVSLSGTLSWDFSVGADSYLVLLGEPGNMDTLTSGTPSGASGNYSYTNLNYYTLYHWRVIEIKGSDYVHGPIWSFTTGPLNEINSWEHLLSLSQEPSFWNLNIQQTTDIDASASAFLDDSDDDNDGNKYNDPNDLTSAGTNDGFSPIGNSTTQFTGSYNGNNYTIKGLTINRPEQDKVGMFGSAGFCSLSNIELQNAIITAYDKTGGIAGFCNESSVSNCRITGTINGNGEVGGMFGSIYNNLISNCLANTIVTGSGSGVGGLTGMNIDGLITESGATGSVNGIRYVGGLSGNLIGTVTYCFSDASVSGVRVTGGLAGRLVASINNCYARGNVTRTSGSETSLGSFGGIADFIQMDIEHCYATGSVTGNNWNPADKGFFGTYNSGDLVNNYWDTQSSSQTSSAGQGENQLEGKTTAEMQQQTTFENWDFDDIWAINPVFNNGYPYLQWQSFSPSNGGSIAEEQTICYGNAPEALTSLSLPTGQLGTLEYKWQYSATSATENFEDIYNSNTTGYSPGILNQTTWFRRLARVSGMPWTEDAASNVVQISVTPAILYVTENGGTSLKDGNSWETAYDKTQLQQAIDQACTEIWVAAGTYYPTTEAGGSGDRYKTYQMKEGIAIYGGFAGNESSTYDKSLRDFQTNETILSGDIGNIGDISDNCYHIFYHPNGLGLTSATLIDGFTISDGNANGFNNPHNEGGGIYSYNNSPEIKNCIFKNNNAWTIGGAYANWYGASHFINCRFSSNTSSHDGAGFFNFPADATLTNCLIDGNHADRFGGGIYNQDASINLINTTICNNQSGADGGGIYNWASGKNPTINNSIFWGNSATGNGNQIYIEYGNLILNYSCYSNGSNDISGSITPTNCITSNPLFVNSGSEDFRLLGNSPAVNSGNNSYNATATDIRGEARIQDVTIDMGAYEWTNGVDPMAQYSWTGNISTAWNETGNWSEGELPTVNYDVLIPSGVSNYPVISNGTGANTLGMNIEAGGSLTINPGGSLITYGDIANSGTINVQRSISNDVWHLISTPVSNATASIFEGDYLQYYNNAWVDIVDENTPLASVKGYSLWSVAKSTTFTFTGNLNTGNQSHAITADQWNLLGNPYPSPIDWSLLDDTYGAVYYWDPLTQNNKSWNNGEGAGAQYVPAMQGFWIKPESSGSFSINNSHRTHNGSSVYYKNSTDLPYSIELQTDAENDYYDQLFIVLDENTTEAFDFQYDAWKLFTSSDEVPQLYSFTGSKRLSIDRRPACNEIPLGFYCGESGAFSIKVNKMNDIGILVLEDKKAETFHDLTKGAYSFDYEYGEDEQRFKLHLNSNAINEAARNAVSIYVSGNNILIQSSTQPERITLTDIAGRRLGVWSHTRQIPAPATAGVYLVTVVSENQILTKKIIIE